MRIPGFGKLLLLREQRIWRKNNRINSTRIIRLGSSRNVTVGRGTYGPISVVNSADAGHLSIGNYCSISDNVTFILSGEHRMDCLSTFPFKARICHQAPEALSKGDIIIADDVWIGFGVTILSGVKIGQGAVIAAGSIVVNDVSPYTVVGGIPAKEIKKRFNDDIIKELLKVDYSFFDEAYIKNNIDSLYTTITDPIDVDKWKLRKDSTVYG